MRYHRVLVITLLLSMIALKPAAMPITGESSSEVDIPPSFPAQKILSDAKYSSSGENNQIIKVVVEGQYSFPVVEQPKNNPGFVSKRPGTLTRFQMAAKYGTIGLLAHNTHAGARFNQFKSGDTIKLTYKNQTTSVYQVVTIRSFKALSPFSPYSNFIDLDNGSRYTATELFYEIYGSGEQLILQTCIKKNGLDTWGRLFVIASPLTYEQEVSTLPLKSSLTPQHTALNIH